MMGAGETTRKVVVEILAEADNFLKSHKVMGDAVKEVVFSFVQLEEKAYGALESIGKKALMTAAGIQATMTANTFMAAQWERQFTMVEKTIDGSTKQIDNLNKGLRDISTTIPVSAGELAGIASIAGQLGIAVDSVQEFTQVAAELGVATDLSSQQAIISLSRVIKVMGESEDTVRNLANSLVHLGNTSNSTEGEILNFAQNIAGTAGVIGITSAEVLGIASAFSSAGIEAEAGGTAVQKVMLAINEAATIGGEKLDNFTNVLGISSQEFKELAETDPAAIFTKFVDALSSAGPEAAQILRQMGLTDQRLTRAFLNVANSSESIGNAIEKSRQEYSGGNALGQEAAKQFDTLTESLNQFKNVMAEIGRSMGIYFVEPFKAVVKTVTWVVNLFNRMPEVFKKIIAHGAGFLSLMLSIAGTAAVFARLYGVLEGIRGILGIKVVSGSLGALLRGLGAGLFGTGDGLLGGIGKLFDRSNTKKLSELDGWLKRIAMSAKAVGEGFGGAARGLITFLRLDTAGRAMARTDFADRIKGIGQAAASPFKRVADGATNAVRSIKDRSVLFGSSAAAAAGMTSGGDKNIDKVVKSATEMSEKVSETIKTSVARIPDMGEDIKRTLYGASQAIQEGVPEVASSAAEATRNMHLAAGSVAKDAKETVDKTGDVMASYTAQTTEKAKGELEETNKTLKDSDKTTKSLASGVWTLEKALGAAMLAFVAYQAVVAAFDWQMEKARERTLSFVDATKDLAKSIGIDFDPTKGGFDPGIRAQSREDYLRNIATQNREQMGELVSAEEEGGVDALQQKMVALQLQLEYGGATDEEAARAMRDLLEATFGPDNPIVAQVMLDTDITPDDVAKIAMDQVTGADEGNFFERLGGLFKTNQTEAQLGGERAKAVEDAARLVLQSAREGEYESAAAVINAMDEEFGGKSAEMRRLGELLTVDETLKDYGLIDPKGIETTEDGISGVKTLENFGVELEGYERKGNTGFVDDAGTTPELIAAIARETGATGNALADAILGIEQEMETASGALIDTRTEFERKIEEFAPNYKSLQPAEQTRIRDQFLKQHEATQGIYETLRLVRSELGEMTTDAERASEEYNQLASAAERLQKALTEATLSGIGTYLSVHLQSPIDRVEYLTEKLKELKAAGADPDLLSGLDQEIQQQGAAALQQLRQVFEVDPKTGEQLDRRAKIERDYQKQREENRENHLERMEDMEEAYQDSITNAVESTFNSFRMQERAFSQRQESLADILWNVEDQNDKFREFNRGMERFRNMLSSAGADDELQDMIIGNLGLDDPANYAQIDRLLTEIDAGAGHLLDDLVAGAKERQGLVTQTTKESTDEITEEYEKQRSKAVEAYEDQAEAAEESYLRQKDAVEAAINGSSEFVMSNAELIEKALNSTDPAVRQLAELAQSYYDNVGASVEEFIQDSIRAGQAVTDLNARLRSEAEATSEFVSTMAADADAAMLNSAKAAADSARQAMDETEGFFSKFLGFIRESLENMPWLKPFLDLFGDNAKTGSTKQQTKKMGDKPVNYDTYTGSERRGQDAYLHAGGIVSGPTRAMLGEGGYPEAVLPLNPRGMQFLQSMAMSMAVRTPTSGFGGGGYGGGTQQTSKTESHTYGPITVQADDPNEMRKKLEARRRLQRLTQPPRAGIGSAG